ncbi:MAG: DNRLRE domain-containing protein [bacterium]|nr:DNRLRE domain-containing protein [bacterium]
MFKLSKMLLLVAMIALVVVGCSQEPNSPLSSDLNSQTANGSERATLGLATAVSGITSATLHLYVISPSSQEVRIHRITGPWDEMTVTWNNFGAAFSPAVEATFVADAVGWEMIDVTALVTAWADGTHMNYGLLLDQDNLSLRTEVVSSDSENLNHPFVVICSDQGCDTIYIDMDTFINERDATWNFGTNRIITFGNVAATPYEKQGLVLFPVPTIEEQLGALGNYVWYDDNMNGIQDEGETGVSGVTVQLFNCEGLLLDEMLTDGDGLYLFDSLPAGGYYVKFSNLPADYVFTSQDQGGDDALDSDADINTGQTICTTLDAGEVDLTWDAGIYKPEMGGCSHTIGYWKTHAGFGPQADEVTQYLPIWLGTDGGTKSMQVTSALQAVRVLNQDYYGTSSNGITKLYAQMLGAKLSMADGADGSAIAATIAAADAFLASHDYLDWATMSRADRSMVNGWKDMLDMYNNGLIGPGHCDEGMLY